jgi:hypothetical protein
VTRSTFWHCAEVRRTPGSGGARALRSKICRGRRVRTCRRGGAAGARPTYRAGQRTTNGALLTRPSPCHARSRPAVSASRSACSAYGSPEVAISARSQAMISRAMPGTAYSITGERGRSHGRSQFTIARNRVIRLHERLREPRQLARIDRSAVSFLVCLPPLLACFLGLRALKAPEAELARRERLNRRELQRAPPRRGSGTRRKPICSSCLRRASGGVPR